jgi:MarR family 2-MHQ and catechol resistance regulon transcriptional repressor
MPQERDNIPALCAERESLQQDIIYGIFPSRNHAMAIPEKKGRELLRLRRSLNRAEQALEELERELLGSAKLCASDLEILERLSRKGDSPVNTLAPRVGLTSGSMTTAVQRLLRRGLVATRRDDKDKRVVWVSATEEGQKLATRANAARIKALQNLFGDWSSREQDLLFSLLKRVRKDAQSLAPKDGSDL